MAVRNIVKIDEDLCNGCGECITACAEGAIQLINGKARLVSEIYCDGLGACLGTCPQDAITIEQREAADFDETATEAHVERLKGAAGGGCPGSMMRQFDRKPATPQDEAEPPAASRLGNWPVQLTLVPPAAPYLRNADLLLVADCVPFAYADFHRKILRGSPVVIGCPKLDDAGAYVEKLAQIIQTAEIASITVVHMEVPCCTGLVRITEAAVSHCDREIPVKNLTIGIQGYVVSEAPCRGASGAATPRR
jgi:NAD-dependent dihydropyrimidine dehydrogenase PreA subunit